ncbi:MAG: ParB N-terminal domain-containing protein, partial [Myxococcales bacterium]|nr:ParB N-terminal domain-containing protein [Myxococcales bacterium]
MPEAPTHPSVEATPLSLLKPAPWNPRKIRDERFQNLVQSIKADPEFLWRRPVLAMADGTIYAGNMRYRAAEHLGLETIPAIREDIPEQLAKERAFRDNAQWGEWVEEDLASMLEALRIDGAAMDLLGFDEREL